jgi:RAQPRD family integrative conjugative element protein
MKPMTMSGLLLALAIALHGNGALAQMNEAEIRYLISIANEIENLKALSRKAAATADTTQRVQFDYQALIQDLSEVQSALQRHVNEPSRSPRVLGEINASYTRVQQDE